MRKVLVASFTLLTIGLVASTGFADQITVTSGQAVLQDLSAPVRMTLNTADSTISIRWLQRFLLPAVTCAPGCQPGDIVSLNTTVFHNGPINTEGLENDAMGSVTVNGVTGPGLAFAGSLSFVTPGVTLPPTSSIDEFGAVTLTAPFMLSGTIQAFNALGREPVLLFTETLTGRGTASARFDLSRSATTYTLSSAAPLRYDFSTETAPIPEPASVLLLCSGLALLVPLSRRRHADLGRRNANR